jgi:transcriptional regulator with XRE-family HTH domain
MGRSHRPKPARLAEKLLQIRVSFGLTQDQIINRLDYIKSPLYPSNVSEFESGKREPPLEVLLAYARAANVYVEVLIDDSLDLPEKIPATAKDAWGLRPNHRR